MYRKNLFGARRRRGVAGYASALALMLAAGAAQAQSVIADQSTLLPRILANPADHDANFAYAHASVEARDYEAAIAALERTLFFNPNLTRAKYELGALYYKLKSFDMAQRYFEDALKTPGLEPDLRARIEIMLPATKKELEPSRLSGVLQLGVGYSSNVPLAPVFGLIRSNGADIPNPGPYYQRGGVNLTALGEVRHVYDFENQRGDTWESRFAGIGTSQFAFGELSSVLVEATTGPRLALAPEALPGASIRPYVAASYATMALGRLGSSIGGGVTARFPIGDSFQVEPGVEWRHLDIAATSRFLEVASTLNTGSQWTGSLAARWRATDRLTFDGKALFGRNSSYTSTLTSRRFGLEGSARIEFDPPSELIGWRWSATPFVRYAETRFSAADLFVDPLVVRVDRQIRVGSQFDMPITKMFGVAALVQYVRNNSNLPNYRASAWSGLIGPTLRF
ncbi:MAG: tetratricopeptide repeat protein [Methylobacteriaceae bacterium]|nr:tetratricopeptide repeat protein [Methylobacteriaceae bacterium]